MRYLNFLIAHRVYKWQYEPDTFWFEEQRELAHICRISKFGTQTSELYYVEVKGWMDAKQNELNRMRIYYPGIKIIVLGQRNTKSYQEQGAYLGKRHPARR